MLPPRWSHLARYGLLGTTLLGVAAQHAAAAPCDDIAASSVSFVAGLEVSPRIKFVGGIEARRCMSDSSEGMARLELGGDKPRLIVGVRARPFEDEDFETRSTEQIGIEGGALIDFQGKLGAHLALSYGTHFAYVAAQLQAKREGSQRVTLLGGFSPWTMTQPAVPGRPIAHDAW